MSIPAEYTTAERQAFIYGMLSTCIHLGTQDWVVTDMCVMFSIKPEELLEVRTMTQRKGKKSGEA